jgi:4-amino-4-deoxy-L-arabinose transferase-like glycosyltransferase
VSTRSTWLAVLGLALGLSLAVGILARGYWTPDEPREADIAWRMSWQPDKAVPLLAGEAFCEKPPLAYWVAGAAMSALGTAGWAARLPNLLYALITAWAVASIARRGAGALAAAAAAAAISTFLLSYQVTIWLATDAPLLACVSAALLGLYVGFHANTTRERLRGYCGMHAALALGFLCKSAAGWMVPVLTLGALIVWERRWRELLRWELYAGVVIQAVLILGWVGFVYQGPDGLAHLKVFFWNNLAGRFARVDAPEELQYAGAHKNSPGKYLLELPTYVWPWTLLVGAALWRAWRERRTVGEDGRLVRFALATFVPTLAMLSVAATARNIYLAPALPGLALLLGWWLVVAARSPTVGDRRLLRTTAALLLIATAVCAAASGLIGRDLWPQMSGHAGFIAASSIGLAVAASAVVIAWRAAGQARAVRSGYALVMAYCALLIGPASQIYRGVDTWQDLAAVGRGMAEDAAGHPLILFAADETTRAFIDMYTNPSVRFMPGPVTGATEQALAAAVMAAPGSWVVTQLPGRAQSRTFRQVTDRLHATHAGEDSTAERLPDWAAPLQLKLVHAYALPNGRRYGLLAWTDNSLP